jgi:hypothetical protein
MVIHRIVGRTETTQMRHVLIVHADRNGPDNLTQRLGDPEMILRPTEVRLLDLIDFR